MKKLYHVRMRGGMGLGDALYVQSVARHLLWRGHKLEVCTKWPEVFSQLQGDIRLAPFSRQNIQVLAHYSMRKGHENTTQFEDCCITAKVGEPVDLCLDWQPRNQSLIDQIKGLDRPLVIVQLPRTPMGRSDGFGAELLPDCRVIQHMIDAAADVATIVQIGSGKPLFEFQGIDLDLANKTSVSDVLDIASVADKFIGYCSFIVPLAESFKKPAMICWSRRGLDSKHAYIRSITPKKILHLETSKYVIDDWTPEQVEAAISDFMR